jgi:hypothetical protein
MLNETYNAVQKRHRKKMRLLDEDEAVEVMYLPVHPRPALNPSMTSMYLPVHPRPPLNPSMAAMYLAMHHKPP